MTIENVTKSVSKTVMVEEVIGVKYTSDSTDRAIRVTPSSSKSGRYTVTISNPDTSNELAIIMKADDLLDFAASVVELLA